jgi:uncharacterized protein
MLDQFSSWLVYSVLQISPDAHFGEVAHFFVYDTVKILALLLIMTHLMSLVRYYLPVSKMRSFLSSRRFFGLDYFFASLFGAITPFCSCSSIPLFVGFVQAKIPLGLTFSFLATSPLVNEIALVLFLSIFGWKITILYAAAGIGIGMVSGAVLGKMGLENEINMDLFLDEKKSCACACKCGKKQSVFKSASKEARSITMKVAPFVIIGVALGAVIHGYVPEGYFEGFLSKENIFSVPIAVIMAVPLYANASGVIPIIEALIAKGVELGTALAFMMAVVGLSLPEALILRRIMSFKLLGAFFGTVTIGIILIGYVFNIIL